MIKGFRQIAVLTIISRLFGLVRDMAFAYFLGAKGLFDVWIIAFKIPNLARRIFGEGAVASSFIPVYSRQLHGDPDGAKRLARTVVTAIVVLLSCVVLVGEAVIWLYYRYGARLDDTRLMFALAGLMLPYMVLICAVAILAGVLNTHRHFAAPAAAPILLNIFIIASLVISCLVLDMEARRAIFVVAAGVLVAGVVQIAIQVPPLLSCGIPLRPAWAIRTEAFKKIMFLMGPMILGLTATQLNTLADDVIAKCLSGSPEKGEAFAVFGHQIAYPVWEGAVSNLYLSQRLYQFPLGVLGISLATAIFPVMSAAAARKDHDALTRTISHGLAGSVFVALPATIGLMIVARPLVAAIFQRGQFTAQATEMTVWPLYFYSLGLCGFFAQQIVTRAFYSVQDSKMPAITAIIAVLVNIVLNLTLIWPLGTAGLALSTAICSYLQVGILVVVLRRRFGGTAGGTAGGTMGGTAGGGALDHMTATIVKTIVGTVVMGLAGWAAMAAMSPLPRQCGWEVLRLAIAVPLCAGVYAVAARVLGNPMLALIIHPAEAPGRDRRDETSDGIDDV